ncbi:MAG: phosphoribosylamine--glycine ligase [Pyrinomonas sp.]|uniref:phosphoribosylamine--glycine ligase n=1 Tax=Pyrinomonas sp. TaxID=2080306 RepID=UPI003323710A
MKVLVIGSGGREHAILWALRRTSERPLELLCAPGNAGIAEIARCVPIAATEVTELAHFAENERVDLTIVGGEAPLARGIVDEFNARGLRIVGPTASAARLEASKVFAKQFMARHRVPTARFRVAGSADEAIAILRRGEFGGPDSPVVIKADGLAAGKGVVVARDRAEAERAVQELMVQRRVGDAAERVVLEEALEGREASVIFWTDGRTSRLMPPARDHKRVGEGDTGPNTGGMGAITAPGVLDRATHEQVVRQTVEPTLEGLRAEGLEFRGVLYLGLMLTPEGPRVLEYNVRLGDPEAQAILVRLRSDLTVICEAAATGHLSETDVEWADGASACVVLAARGYPERVETGAVISGLEKAAAVPGVEIFHAGTERGPQGEWRTAGGRVLGVASAAPTLDEALAQCYRAAERISWQGMNYRRDIGR